MYGLFLKTYDCFERSDLVCASDEESKLADFHARIPIDSIYGKGSLLKGLEQQIAAGKHANHYTIEKIQII